MIYAPFETFLKETFGEDCREGEMHRYLYFMWRGLHYFLLDEGFDIENVVQFIEMYKKNDYVRFTEQPPA